MRENLTLEEAAALVGKPADLFRVLVRGTIRKNRPEPQPPERFAHDLTYEVHQLDGRWWVSWRVRVWGDGKLVYSTAASVAAFDDCRAAEADAASRRAAIALS